MKVKRRLLEIAVGNNFNNGVSAGMSRAVSTAETMSKFNRNLPCDHRQVGPITAVLTSAWVSLTVWQVRLAM